MLGATEINFRREIGQEKGIRTVLGKDLDTLVDGVEHCTYKTLQIKIL